MHEIVIKRTNNELKYFDEKKYMKDDITNKLKELYDDLYFIRYENKNDNTYHIEIRCIKMDEFIIDIIYPKNYPFSSYSIYKYNLYNKTYNYNVYLLNILSNKLRKYPEYIILLNYLFNNLYNKGSIFLKNKDIYNICLCCKSLTCPHNWSPGLTINNLILEYYEVLFINEQCSMKNYILNKRIEKKILDYYLKGNVDLYENIMNINYFGN